jgi:hypothetical protein
MAGSLCKSRITQNVIERSYSPILIWLAALEVAYRQGGILGNAQSLDLDVGPRFEHGFSRICNMNDYYFMTMNHGHLRIKTEGLFK